MNHLSSREAFEAHCRRHARSTQITTDLVVARVCGDGIVAGDPDDYGLVPHLCLDGFWESWISLCLLRAIRPGWSCVDVGASYGYFTSLMGRAAGPTGKVIAVEPNPAIHSRYLPRTLALSGLDATGIIRPVALSDRCGEAMLSIPDHRSMNATVGDDQSGVPVAVTTMDAMLAEDRADIVKIDAEGAEERIWEGMRETIARNPDMVVVLEYNAGRYADPMGFVRRIEGDGFDLCEIHNDGVPRPISTEECADPAHGRDRMLWLRKSN